VLLLQCISEVAFELFVVGNASGCVCGEGGWRYVLGHLVSILGGASCLQYSGRRGIGMRSLGLCVTI